MGADCVKPNFFKSNRSVLKSLVENQLANNSDGGQAGYKLEEGGQFVSGILPSWRSELLDQPFKWMHRFLPSILLEQLP